MVKNIIIFSLIIFLVFLYQKFQFINNQISTIKENSVKIIRAANEKELNDFNFEIYSFKKLYNSKNHLLINVDNLENLLLDLKKANQNAVNLDELIDVNHSIKNQLIPFFDNPFAPEEFIISKDIHQFYLKNNDTLFIPVSLKSLNFQNHSVYEFVDTLNFKKIDKNRGQFILQSDMIKKTNGQVQLKYFLKNNLTKEIRLMSMQKISIDFI